MKENDSDFNKISNNGAFTPPSFDLSEHQFSHRENSCSGSNSINSVPHEETLNLDQWLVPETFSTTVFNQVQLFCFSFFIQRLVWLVFNWSFIHIR